MKNTAKTLTLTAKKAPAKASAPLAVPKTATSYFLETEAAAKVTVVKTRSRLATLKAQADAILAAGGPAPEPVAAPVAAEPVAEPVAAAPVVEPVEAPVQAVAAEVTTAVADAAAADADAGHDPAEDYMPAQAKPGAPPVIVRKRGRLAALKAAEPEADVAAEAVPVAAAAVAEKAVVADEAPKVVRTRTARQIGRAHV